MKLANKVAVITGGNSGIGLAIAKEFVRQGAKVAIQGRNADTLAAAEKELGEGTLAMQGDVRNLSDLESLMATAAAQLGPIDIVVANAGGATVQPFLEVDEASFDAQVGSNYKGTFFTVQKAVPRMNDGGAVILLSSIAADRGLSGMSAYAGTKGAVNSLARVLTAELAPRGIRVNVLSPGPIDTPIMGRLGLPDEHIPAAKEGFASLVPMGKRFGEAAEMATIAAFLASDDASYVHGAYLTADGGASQVMGA